MVVTVLFLLGSVGAFGATPESQPHSPGICPIITAGSTEIIAVPDDGCTTAIDGELTTKAELGPPGYGIGGSPEQDEKVTIYVLTSTKPYVIREPTDAKPVELRLKRIQIIVSTEEQVRFLESALGKHISVQGELDWSTAPAEYTDVVIFPEKIRLITGESPR